MSWQLAVPVLLVWVLVAARGVTGQTAATYHHVHLTSPVVSEAVKWYAQHMGCQPIAGRTDGCEAGPVRVMFSSGVARGTNQGTAVDSIGFSFPDLAAKIKEFRTVGSGGDGVRILTPIHEEPGLYKAAALVADTLSTRIEVVEDPEYLGFHHITLKSADPDGALQWYQQAFGGQPSSLKGQKKGLLFGKVWLFVIQAEGPFASTAGRTLDHFGFSFPSLDAAAGDLKKKGIVFQQEPRAVTNGPVAKNAFVLSPDNVRIEVVQP